MDGQLEPTFTHTNQPSLSWGEEETVKRKGEEGRGIPIQGRADLYALLRDKSQTRKGKRGAR